MATIYSLPAEVPHRIFEPGREHPQRHSSTSAKLYSSLRWTGLVARAWCGAEASLRASGIQWVKIDIGKFGTQQRAELVDLVKRRTRHAIYWQQAPALTHTLRYVLLRVVLKKPG